MICSECKIGQMQPTTTFLREKYADGDHDWGSVPQPIGTEVVQRFVCESCDAVKDFTFDPVLDRAPALFADKIFLTPDELDEERRRMMEEFHRKGGQ